PGGHEPFVEAVHVAEGVRTDGQRGRGRLLDCERAAAVFLRVARRAAARVVREEVIEEEELAGVGGEAREAPDLEGELVLGPRRRQTARAGGAGAVLVPLEESRRQCRGLGAFAESAGDRPEEISLRAPVP